MAVALLALFVALGGTGYAALRLPNNSVGTRQIKKNAVSSSKIKKNAVNSGKISNGSLRSRDLNASVLKGFVTKVPGTVNEAANSAALAGHPARDFAIRGADITGTIHGDAGAVAPHSCTTAPLEATGTRVGDLAVIGFVGSTPPPQGLTFQLLKVTAPGNVTIRFCNPTNAASPAFANVGVRVIAFR